MKKKNILGSDYIELTGSVHNHTKYSYDSKVPLKKIIRLALKCELDYITINDHRTFDARNDPNILLENDLLIMVGAEINDPDNNNHYLVFNTDKIILNKSAEEYVNYYKRTSAIGFAAHPIEHRVNSAFRKYIWTDFNNNQFDGLEIWNFLSEWVGKLNPKINGLLFVLFPTIFVCKPLPEILSWWDEMNNKGMKKSAIGSVDSHEEKIKKFGILFKFLKHKTLFNTIRTNVLLAEGVSISQQNVLEALKKGNSYIVNYYMGNPYNFYAGIKSVNGDSIIFGQEIDFQENMKLYFRLPVTSRVSLICNGKRISSRRNDKGFFLLSKPGNYRLEITRWGRGWIYTNNFYVK